MTRSRPIVTPRLPQLSRPPIGRTLCGLLVCLLPTAATADPRHLSVMPDPRGEFIRLCAPFMTTRYAHPEAVCDCLRNAMFSEIEDPDLRDAMLYGITERGVPTLSHSWLDSEKWPQIDRSLTAIAAPTMACMFGDKPALRATEVAPSPGFAAMPPVQDLVP